MNILVHPTYREGFGKVLQEAMSLAIPVITTDVPGPSEVVEDGISGVLVPVKDAKALAKAMETLMLDVKKCVDMGEAALTRAHQYFSRPIMLKHILSDYCSILRIMH
jgi:glycosyltransferase involved in cell wall biosynthesis